MSSKGFWLTSKAFIVVGPTYYGLTSDVTTLAAVCHEHGIAPIVDAA